jgi:aspartyl-tRNA(Asn)/glutamyl-tRNA(Gln) amidotransferase subunit B
MQDLKPIMGLEIHIQLNTESKLFCHCSTEASEPNSACCEICLGMPGSKPVLNEKALEMGLKIALALNCKINNEFFFSRKTYFYPDLAKDFQITQFEIPLGINGELKLKSGKKIRIRRVHLEEDPAALVHEQGMHESNYCLIDYNRSGIPLTEIVTEPDLESPEEAREFLDLLLNLLNYLNVFILGKNTLKVDTNISIKGFERVEVKNITGFKAVEAALKFETERQKKLIAEGKKPVRETRAFDEPSGKTRSLRTKETEEDYGYIFEPDLSRIEVSEVQIAELKGKIPELPEQRMKKLVSQIGLTEYDARVIVSDKELSELYFALWGKTDPKLVSKFLTRELLAVLNHENITIKELNEHGEKTGLEAKLGEILRKLQKGSITQNMAKENLIKYIKVKKTMSPLLFEKEVVCELGQEEKISDAGEIEKICEKVILQNQKAVEDFRKGEEKAFNFLVGQVARAAKGKADAVLVRKILEKKIKK